VQICSSSAVSIQFVQCGGPASVFGREPHDRLCARAEWWRSTAILIDVELIGAKDRLISISHRSRCVAGEWAGSSEHSFGPRSGGPRI
jgi:hypothetical protein